MLHIMSLLALTLIALGELGIIIRINSRFGRLKKNHEAMLSHRSDYGIGTGPRHWSGEKK